MKHDISIIDSIFLFVKVPHPHPENITGNFQKNTLTRMIIGPDIPLDRLNSPNDNIQNMR